MTRQLLLAMLIAIASLAAMAEEVECDGYGASEREAIKDALRNAVEQGAGTKIFSETVVQNFVALKDVLVSRSFGLVTENKVLSSSQDKEGIWTVRIRANVSADLDDKWAQIKIALEQKGHPSVMFYIHEYLDGRQIPTFGENAAIQHFKNLGFRVIDRDITLKTIQRERRHAKERPDIDTLIKMAATRGAHLLITGTWEGNFNERSEGPGGLEYLVHSYNLQTRIYRTDSYQVVGATQENFSDSKEAITYNQYNAGRAGFAGAVAAGYLQKIIVDLLKSWIMQQQEGDDITLEINDIRYHHGLQLVKFLRSLSREIASAEIDGYQNEHMTIALKSKIDIHSLAEKLSEIVQFPLEIVGVTKNKLQLRYANFE